jgi:predicted cobalt transporter CbtA
MLAVVFLYVLVVSLCGHFLPAIDEVPANFPASLLWKFRIASWETQTLLWGVLGLLFGWLTERAEGTTKEPLRRVDSTDAMRHS